MGWGVGFATNGDFRSVNREVRPRVTWTKKCGMWSVLDKTVQLWAGERGGRVV